MAGSSLLSEQLTVSERGRTQGASEVLVSLGAAAGSLGAGALFAWGDIRGVSLVGLGFALALLGSTIWTMLPRRALATAAVGQD